MDAKMARDRTPEDFVESIDPGLLPYKEELFCLSVTSEETLKYLRPREVQAMNLPVVYKRLLIDRICNMQTPDTKKKLKEESQDQGSVSTGRPNVTTQPKRLFGVGLADDNQDSLTTAPNVTTVTCEDHEPVDKPFLEKEIEKMKDERDSLTILMLHKKNELKDMRMIPEPLQPMAIPGGVILKTVCDKCHHRGHKAHGNRGNQACPFDQCEGYMYCGNLTKHKEYKQAIIEAEKEVSNLEKEIKGNEDKITNLRAFLQHNTTNFVKMLKPRLQVHFPQKYIGKDGNQALQKDLRFLKIATNGKIPANLSTMSPGDLDGLMNAGRKMVSSKFKVESDDLAGERTVVTTSVSTSPPTNTNSTLTYPASYSALPTQGQSHINPMYPYQFWPGMYSSGMYHNYNYDHTSYPVSPGLWYGSPHPRQSAATSTVSSPTEVSTGTLKLQENIFPPLPLDPPQIPRPPSPE